MTSVYTLPTLAITNFHQRQKFLQIVGKLGYCSNVTFNEGQARLPVLAVTEPKPKSYLAKYQNQVSVGLLDFVTAIYLGLDLQISSKCMADVDLSKLTCMEDDSIIYETTSYATAYRFMTSLGLLQTCLMSV